MSGSETLSHVFRGEKQECKFFDQLVKIFGSKYMLNPVQQTENSQDVDGEKRF